jgi:hypothetical protein
LITTKWLLLAAGVAISFPAIAQGLPAPETAVSSVPAKPEKIVEGATPGAVAQVERCAGHKFESLVEIDPIRKRSTRVKLCANPGSSDAEWVKTLEAAIGQIDQRAMPAAAKEKLIGELKNEIAKFAPSKAAPAGRGIFLGNNLGAKESLIQPAERFETSTLPPLTPKKAVAANAVSARPQKPIGIRIKCLSRGEPGAGQTCDFFDRNTILLVSAVQGLEKGGTMRFRRKGEERGEAELAPMKNGQLARVKLPAELCRGISHSKVDIELLGPDSAGMVAGRLGPYGLRC